MDDATVANGLCRVYFGAEEYRVIAAKPFDSLRPDAVSRRHSEHVAIDDKHHAAQRRTDAEAAPGDRVENRLRVGRRVPDHAKDVARRSLPRQRLAHLRTCAWVNARFLSWSSVNSRTSRKAGHPAAGARGVTPVSEATTTYRRPGVNLDETQQEAAGTSLILSVSG